MVQVLALIYSLISFLGFKVQNPENNQKRLLATSVAKMKNSIISL